MDRVNRPSKPKKEDLLKLYDTCNEIFNKKECFYEKEEFKKIVKRKEAL